jgi:hypothetical protein
MSLVLFIFNCAGGLMKNKTKKPISAKKTILEKMLPFIAKLERIGKQFCLYACNGKGIEIFLLNNVLETYSLLAPSLAESGMGMALVKHGSYLKQDKTPIRLGEEIFWVYGGKLLTEQDGEMTNMVGAFGFYVVDLSIKEAEKIFSLKPNSSGGV